MAKKPFIIWDDKHGSHGVCIEKCADCLIEDVTYYGRGVNAGLFIMNCPGTITMRRFNILTPPGSGALLSCSGGGQMIDCRGALVWEDCWFDKVDDDGADVFTGYNRILKQIDARTLLVEGRRGYATNDQVAILDWPTRVDRHQAVVVSSARQDDGNTKLVVDRVRCGKSSTREVAVHAKTLIETQGSGANLLWVFPWLRTSWPGDRRSSATQGRGSNSSSLAPGRSAHPSCQAAFFIE
jgi:hypothetical protein